MGFSIHENSTCKVYYLVLLMLQSINIPNSVDTPKKKSQSTFCYKVQHTYFMLETLNLCNKVCYNEYFMRKIIFYLYMALGYV